MHAGAVKERQVAGVADFAGLEVEEFAALDFEAGSLLAGEAEAFDDFDVAEGFGGGAGELSCFRKYFF